MSLAKTNRKFVSQLRNSLDIEATQAALDRDEITPIQARNIIKWIVAVKNIRENPLYTMQDEAGQFIGEVITRGGGTSWIARRYGKGYPNDAAEFADRDEAVAFVHGKVIA